MSNEWFKRENRKKFASYLGENETYNDLTSRKHRRYKGNVKVILWEFLHIPVVADIDKKKIRNAVRKTRTTR